jgi:hypothetical protein
MRVVLESPYKGNIEENTEYARRCVKQCLQKGESVFASHLLYTQAHILNDSVEDERTTGIQLGQKWIEVADKLVVFTDFGISSGMQASIEYASNIGKPIEYRSLFW